MAISLAYTGKRCREDILRDRPSGTLHLSGTPDWEAPQLYFGDNYAVLHHLRQRYSRQIDLVYIDPPFGTGRIFRDKDQQHAYDDRLVDDRFLDFLHHRLVLLHELLSPAGSLYLHIDKKIGHYVKILMDEVFGPENFVNDITRIKCNPKNFDRQAYGNCSDMILFYAREKGRQHWYEQRIPLSSDQVSQLFPKTHPEKGPYTTHPLHAPGETQNGDTGKPWRGIQPPKGRHWRYNRKVLDQLDRDGKIEWSATGNPRKMVFAADHKGAKVQDVWEFKDKGMAFSSYPTEKNRDLLHRIIRQSSPEGGWVLDAFAGSGTTLRAAQALNRRWIGIDASDRAMEVLHKNLAKDGGAFQLIQYQLASKPST